MRYVKLFESYYPDNFEFVDIVNVLQDLIDEYKDDFYIYSANGLYFKSEDLKHPDLKSSFRFKRYETQNYYQFKFKINFTTGLNYEKSLNVMNDVLVAINRFKDIGWILSTNDISNTTDDELSEYKVYSLEYVMIKND